MLAIHIIDDSRAAAPGLVPYIDFEIYTAPGVCDNVLYRCTLDRPNEFTKLYGLGKGARPGVAARGDLRRKVSAALPLLWSAAAPVIFID